MSLLISLLLKGGPGSGPQGGRHAVQVNHASGSDISAMQDEINQVRATGGRAMLAKDLLLSMSTSKTFGTGEGSVAVQSLIARDADGTFLGALQGAMMNNKFEVDALAVNPRIITGEISAKGVGTNLMVEAARLSDGHPITLVSADSKSDKFYEALGMNRVGSTKFQWDASQVSAIAAHGIHKVDNFNVKSVLEAAMKYEEENGVPLAGTLSVHKAKLHVIHYSSNDDLPQSVRDSMPDTIAQTIFRSALNSHLSSGNLSEMHAYIKAYRILTDAGYVKGDDNKWKQGGPGGVPIGKLHVYHGGDLNDPNVPPVTYWTPDKNIAQTYAEKTDTGKVFHKDLHLKNPAPEPKVKEYASKIGIRYDDAVPARVFDQRLHGAGSVRQLTEKLINDGHDGTILNDLGHKTNALAVSHVEFNKAIPTSQMTHVNRPLGSKEEEKDDPGTQDVDPPPVRYFADTNTIQNPSDARNKKAVTKRISGSSPISLNRKGVELAQNLGERIAAKGCLNLIYSSILTRGKETVEAILDTCPHMVYAKPNPDLCPWHLGVYEGKEPKDVKDQIVYFIEHPDDLPPGKGADGAEAETFNDAKKRQLGFFRKIYEEDFAADPTLKIGIQTHSRGQELLQAWVDAGCPDDYDIDEKDLIHPDDAPHASVMRWHKDEIREIDLDDDDPLKPGVYLILHSLTNDDTDDGNPELEKVNKYLPPLEVHRAASDAWNKGISVLGITSELAEGEGLTVDEVIKIAEHFDAVESVTEPESTRNAWGGSLAGKWAYRVLKKAEKDFKQKYPSWIGVDLDGTLAKPLESYNPTEIGDPITDKPFFNKVKQAVKDGKPVRIFTARVAHDPEGTARDAIQAWTLKYLGKKLPVTNEKDPGMTELWDDRAHHPDEITKAGNGVMISFWLDPETAKKLAVPDGEKPEEMHITLVYLGKLAGIPLEKISGLEMALSSFAQNYAPISGEIAGPIRFPACVNTEGRDVCVASFEYPRIQEFRQAIVECIEGAGIDISKTFSYTPHITIRYIDPEAPLPVQRIVPMPVTFNKITLSIGGAKKEYELTGVRKETGSKEGSWVTINGQHILVGADGQPIGGNPKAYGRQVSAKVEIARKNAVLTGAHEQRIADKSEEKLSRALNIPRTSNNSAFDLRNDDIGVEVKTMVTGKNDKLTMGKSALGRKLAEAQAEGIKTYTVVADMRGRSSAKYYVSEKLGSLRLGSMTPVTLNQLREMVKP